MKTRTAYYISMHWLGKSNDDTNPITKHDCSQYLLPNELHLIKTMLNEGRIITGVEKHSLTESEYRALFG